MNYRSYSSWLFVIIFSFYGNAIGGDTSTTAANNNNEENVADNDILVGNFEAGEERYKKSCINCHGAAGKGVASYPKVSGQELSYTKSKLETYRDGIKIGPNSSLMIMMAKPLTDEDIANLATYLKDAES